MFPAHQKIVLGGELYVLRMDAFTDLEFCASFFGLRDQHAHGLALLPYRQDDGDKRQYCSDPQQAEVDPMHATQSSRRLLEDWLQVE